MSGLKSRRKGNRGEYLIRDALREAGYVVDRIPASGAAQGFKGDLRIKLDGREIIVEVKLRQNEFSKLYAVVDPRNGFFYDGVIASFNPQDIIPTAERDIRIFRTSKEALPKVTNLLNKLLVYRANSDILVVKDDRKKPIYLRWLATPHLPKAAAA